MKKSLLEDYNKLTELLNNKERRAVHLNSMGNFIEYFEQLETNKQQETNSLLKKYFMEVTNDKLTSKIFDSYYYEYNYLNKIGYIYVSELGFTFQPAFSISIFFGVLLILFCFIINSTVLNIIVCGFLLYRSFRIYNNVKTKKYYRVGW